MADDKRGREEQAQNEKRRQRERDMKSDRARGDEPEPPAADIEEVESALDELDFPTTGTEIVATVGDHAVTTRDGHYTFGDLVPATEAETFDSPAAVSAQVQRPTVAAAMKRVIEASDTLPNAELPWSQRRAYETTFRELAAIDADDDDEGIRAISDWIVERIDEKEKLPGSRDVRRQAAKFCRANGYQIRTDEWLGV